VPVVGFCDIEAVSMDSGVWISPTARVHRLPVSVRPLGKSWFCTSTAVRLLMAGVLLEPRRATDILSHLGLADCNNYIIRV